MKPTKIGYLELKQAIAQTEEDIARNERTNQISAIALVAFEKEIKKYPAPKMNKELKDSSKELF